MRSQFDQQLSDINVNLLEMAEMIEDAIAKAILALKTHDTELAKQVIENDDEVDNKERDIERLCLKILLQQQPVARDLRLVSTALKVITDMERIGDHAADISEITEDLSTQTYIKELEHIPQMADAAIKMLHDSIEAYVKKDIELAQAVVAYDDVVDELFMQVKKDLIALVHENADTGEQAFDLLMIAKYIERIGDHAVNIAEWVVFSLTGIHKNEQIL